MDTRIYLTHADHGRAMTWEEFRASDAELGYRYELIEGKVYVTFFPTLSHQCYRDWLYHTLNAYANEHPDILARAMTFPAVFVPNPNTITFTRTDIACYTEFAERFAPDADYRDYSPLLVVEVLSTDDPDKDLVRNRRLYLQVPSIREYWILDPREGVEGLTMLVYRRRGRRWAPCRTVAAGETYTTTLLPGFSLVLDPHAS
jgi:Uma2 family endonuclease